MNKAVFLSIGLFFSFTFGFGQGKNVEDVFCMITDGEKPRFVTLLSDNTVWWSINGGTWTQISNTGLPEGRKIKMIDGNSTAIAVLDDNTLWTYIPGKAWSSLSSAGLPKDGIVKLLKVYLKYTLSSAVPRCIVILEDNTAWWLLPGKPWQSVPVAGLPDQYVINDWGVYQKTGSFGYETRCLVTLSDNTVWWYADGKKWQKLDTSGMPPNATFKKFAAYMKTLGRVSGRIDLEGRLAAVFRDESIWWVTATKKEWEQIDTGDLPKGYKIKALEVFQDYFEDAVRLIIILEDNSIWWYAEYKGWTPVDTEELITAK